MKRVVACILTSSDIRLLLNCFNSVVQQQVPHEWVFDVFINVNTLTNTYYNEVIETFKETNFPSDHIYQTVSNGKPGKGHNSCFTIFNEKFNEFDYMFMIDGDDMYYPDAFKVMIKAINNTNPDILHLCCHDQIKLKTDNLKIKHTPLHHNFIVTHGDEVNYLSDVNWVNPFNTPIETCKTPSRVLAINHKATHIVKYSEELKLYDDLLAFCTIAEAELSKKIKGTALSHSSIYIYNAINDNSATKHFNHLLYKNENKIWKRHSKDFKVIRKHWDRIKHLNWYGIGYDVGIDYRIRMGICDQICKNEINYNLKMLDKCMAEKQHEKGIEFVKKLIDFGVNNDAFLPKDVKEIVDKSNLHNNDEKHEDDDEKNEDDYDYDI